MHTNLLLILFLLVVTFFLVMLGQKLKIAYPIFLVLAGLAISFVPGIPRVAIEPEMIFMIFLPPLLYEAAWYTSWNEFARWSRVISMLAFGLVFVTSIIIAYVSHAMIPGFTLALGFLLGGIVSPPDAVAAASVLKFVKVPARITSILEGESLINDASSLIVFRFALLAILTSQFSLGAAVGQFFISAGAGIAIGIAIALIMYAIHRYLPTTPNIDSALTLLTPYFMYLAAEHFHFSGVLAVVSGGLFLSYRSHEILSNSDSRMVAWGLWSTVIFVLNALVFILIGLQLPVIVDDLGDYSIGAAIGYGVAISLVAMVIRLIWVFPIAYVPKWLGQTVRMDHVNPTWKGPLIIGWAGMRGVVSLASALSIPLLLNNGQPFPHRNLILFITFIVILATLVFQGLTLPLVIKWTDMKDISDYPPAEEQEAAIRIRLMNVAIQRLDEKYGDDLQANELVQIYRRKLTEDVEETRQLLNSLECAEMAREEVDRYNQVMLDLFDQQRKELFRIRKEKKYSDEEIRKQEDLIDYEEGKITEQPGPAL